MFILNYPEVKDMTDTTIDVMPISSSTADVSPISLKKSEQIRLKFVPI